MSTLLRFLLAPASAAALQQRTVVLTTGIRISFTQLLANITAFLAVTGVGFCTLVFLLGAAQIVTSHGDQTKIDNGKKMMFGSLTGLALITCSYGIIRTVLWFLYGGMG